MTREISQATKKDLELKRLREIIQEVIKTPREWEYFKTYVDDYYKKLK